MATLAAPRPLGAAEVDWVFCRGRLREIDAGLVRCPLRRARVVASEACLECRELLLVANERAAPDCSTLVAPVSRSARWHP